MAQESWKETDETECQTPKGPILCANNCGFFGSSGTNNLCSKCYRDIAMKQHTIAAPPPPAAEHTTAGASASVQRELASVELDEPRATQAMAVDLGRPEDKKPANRCLACRKRVGLSGFKCRCGGTFCSTHRLSETHECSFDYKTAGREAIAKENPVVKAKKIVEI